MWKVSILSLFPEIFPGQLNLSVIGSALEKGIWGIDSYNIRDYALDKHKTVDDAVYGGGNGMLLKPDVLAYAIDACFVPNKLPIICLSPCGRVFNQKIAHELITLPGVNIICGRFEGIDERIFIEYKIDRISLGDFVLSSGDVAVVPVLDACIRLLPGVIRDDALREESFGSDPDYRNLLEYPQYTRPSVWRGNKVPDILLSGNHEKIRKWRLEQAINKTEIIRPDLI
jgi:tRNA (guanine37-N1)-methyltransferase